MNPKLFVSYKIKRESQRNFFAFFAFLFQESTNEQKKKYYVLYGV